MSETHNTPAVDLDITEYGNRQDRLRKTNFVSWKSIKEAIKIRLERKLRTRIQVDISCVHDLFLSTSQVKFYTETSIQFTLWINTAIVRLCLRISISFHFSIEGTSHLLWFCTTTLRDWQKVFQLTLGNNFQFLSFFIARIPDWSKRTRVTFIVIQENRSPNSFARVQGFVWHLDWSTGLPVQFLSGQCELWFPTRSLSIP